MVLKLGIAAILPFILVIATIPQIRMVAMRKRIVSRPNHRTVHENNTPKLGGVGIFISILFTSFLILNWGQDLSWTFIFSASLILFVFSLRDDLLDIKPIEKFLGQFSAAALLILGTGWSLSVPIELLGIGEWIPSWLNYGISIVFLVLIINSFNLIDGVDGLAAMLVITFQLFVSFLFLVRGLDAPVLFFSLIWASAYLGFLPFNYSSKRKMFLGEVGSSFGGFGVGILFFYLFNHAPFSGLSAEKHFLFSISLIFLPVADVLRLFAFRIMQGKSPFVADNHHIHHIFLKMGASHRMAGLLVVVLHWVIVIGLIAADQIAKTHTALMISIGALAIYFVLVGWLAKNLSSSSAIRTTK